jgi:eukaryotic-like serine/threonine-protein kinase
MTIPAQLNHYTILQSIGQGGMGEVFVAEDTRLHRRVALKVLSGLGSEDPERRSRFEREARAVAALNHPSIVTIHSVEEADGVPFLTMELVEGRALSSLIPGSGMPLDALLRIAIETSDAMAAAHQRGITHRDLKPANVMVTDDGRVKVLDFGLAKLREADAGAAGVTRLSASELTGEGRIIGTVAYMSPEQAEGKPVDPRSDIFSLGVLLHEMATGERPFKGDTNVSVMSSILKDTPSAITDINPTLPAGLAKIIRRALAKDPSRRYQTATDLRNELEELQQELRSAETVSLSSTAARPSARRTSRAVLLVAGALVLTLGTAAGVRLWRSSGSPARATFELDRFSRLTNTGNAQIAAIAPDGRYVVHIKNDDGKPGLWVRQTATFSDVQIVPPAEVRYDGLTFSPDANFVYYVTYGRLGGVASLYRIPVLGGTPQRVLEDIDSRVSFSPDATQVTFIRGSPNEGRNYLMIANAGGSDARRLASLSAPDQFQLTAPSWSPDGRTILAGVQSLRDGPHNAVFAVDVRNATTTNIGGRWPFTNDLEWMPDGRSFVVSAVDFGSQTPQLWQVMWPGGERRRITNDLNNYIGVSVSRDGASIATVQVENASNIWVVGRNGASAPAQVTKGSGRNDGSGGLSWTADGKIVFSSTATGRQEIWIMDADGSNQRALTSGSAPSQAPFASPDGRYIVFQRPEAQGMFLMRMATDGASVEPLTKTGSEFQPIVGPDGRWVYYNSPASGQPRPFKVAIDGGASTSLGDVYFRPLDISPDGSQLLGLGWDQAQRRSALATLPSAGGPVTLLPLQVFGAAAWSPDGRGIMRVEAQNGQLNVFEVSLDGKATRQLTHFTSGNLYGFARSKDGTRLAIAHGTGSADVVLVSRKAEGK